MEITEISNLDRLTSLKVLNLSGNRIKKIENINKLLDLKELYL